MKKLHVLTVVFWAGLLITGCSQKDTIVSDDEPLSLKSASVAGKYIVVLKEDEVIAKAELPIRNFKVKEKALGLLKKYEVTGEIEEVYQTVMQGFTVKMAPGQAKKMEVDSDVYFVEADRVISLSPIEMNGKPGGGGGTTIQTTPWGISRVGGPVDGTGKIAWIIDTGIDLIILI